jgi:hypothetical protein
VQINTVEVIARFFGRDGELGLVDQTLEVRGLEREFVAHLAWSEIRKVALRQSLQRKARPAGADGQRGAVARRFQHDLCALRQFAYDVIEHVRGHGRRPGGAGFGGDRVGHFEIEVGRLEAQLRAVGANQHISQNGNRVATLDRAVHVTERLQQLRTLNGNLHRHIPFKGVAKVAWRGAFGKGRAGAQPCFP